MKFFVTIVTVLIISNFANAGATYYWCSSEDLPNIKICVDQTGESIHSSGLAQKFNFISYGNNGEDRSVVISGVDSSKFKLVYKHWGTSMFLVDSQYVPYPLQCEPPPHHGLCPSSPGELKPKTDKCDIESTLFPTEKFCEGPSTGEDGDTFPTDTDLCNPQVRTLSEAVKLATDDAFQKAHTCCFGSVVIPPQLTIDTRGGAKVSGEFKCFHQPD